MGGYSVLYFNKAMFPFWYAKFHFLIAFEKFVENFNPKKIYAMFPWIDNGFNLGNSNNLAAKSQFSKRHEYR